MNPLIRFVIYMLIIVLTLLLLPGGVKAEDSGWWTVATVRSYHHQRNKKHNEDNWGLGAEKNLTREWTFAAGFYDNSYDQRSVYAGMIWTPIHIDYVHFGLSGGVVDGYGKHPFSFFLFPVMAVQGKNYGFNIALVPSFHTSYTVIGLQLKAKF